MELLVVKSVIFALLAPGTVAGVVPMLIVRAADGWGVVQLGLGHYAGALFFVPGLTIVAWTFSDFVRHGRGTPNPAEPPRHLVVTGLYRHTRNPMYVGVGALVLGEAMYTGSLPLLAYTAAIFLLWQCFIVFYEEPTLRKLFGEEFERYQSHVPRWLPRLRPWRPEASA